MLRSVSSTEQMSSEAMHDTVGSCEGEYRWQEVIALAQEESLAFEISYLGQKPTAANDSSAAPRSFLRACAATDAARRALTGLKTPAPIRSSYSPGSKKITCR